MLDIFYCKDTNFLNIKHLRHIKCFIENKLSLQKTTDFTERQKNDPKSPKLVANETIF